VKKSELVQQILGSHFGKVPENHRTAEAFAPSNIALCKYWGKRDTDLNLPLTSSLSVALPAFGSHILLSVNSDKKDEIILNDSPVQSDTQFYRRFIDYINLFRPKLSWYFKAVIHSTVPVSAGLASSASGFASLVLALNQLFEWQFDRRQLSVLARLGSGSACRSLWDGFVEWQAGVRADGMDSHGVPLEQIWPDLCLGLLIFSVDAKPISSREAMQRTVQTSRLYRDWPAQVSSDMEKIKKAIREKNFLLLGESAEANAIAMHATMADAIPGISYALPETKTSIQKIRQMRDEGISVYFTQDAGPNLKLIFLRQDMPDISRCFPGLQVVQLFSAGTF